MIGSLRQSEGFAKRLTENKLHVCMLGLEQFSDAWPFAGWIHRLFDQLLRKDQQTAFEPATNRQFASTTSEAVGTSNANGSQTFGTSQQIYGDIQQQFFSNSFSSLGNLVNEFSQAHNFDLESGLVSHFDSIRDDLDMQMWLAPDYQHSGSALPSSEVSFDPV